MNAPIRREMPVDSAPALDVPELEEGREAVDLPAYQDLPEVEGGARSGWHVFGPDDEVGLINLLTPERVVAAARLVKTGERFSLSAPTNIVDPPLYSRGAARHHVFEMRPGVAIDEVYDNFYPQSSSQWDSLAHVAFTPGVFYNGATTEEVLSGARNGIENWGERGIVGRGVLLDLRRQMGDDFDPSDTFAFTVEDLERARVAQGLEYQVGDILILRTGFLEHHITRTASERAAQSIRSQLTCAGLAHGGEMAEYLWDSHVSAVAADNPGVEVWPPDEGPGALPLGFLHTMLIGQFGMAVGELWWLKDLAEACEREQRWEFMLASVPLNASGGIGSPANAIAIL